MNFLVSRSPAAWGKHAGVTWSGQANRESPQHDCQFGLCQPLQNWKKEGKVTQTVPPQLCLRVCLEKRHSGRSWVIICVFTEPFPLNTRVLWPWTLHTLYRPIFMLCASAFMALHSHECINTQGVAVSDWWRGELFKMPATISPLTGSKSNLCCVCLVPITHSIPTNPWGEPIQAYREKLMSLLCNSGGNDKRTNL